jgi:bacterioferritin (cytochrome b1)
MSLYKLAQKFEDKYLLVHAADPATDNMSKIVAAANALHQIRTYLDGTPNLDPNASPSVKNGAAVIRNFKTYQQAVEENLALYYDPETKQYTPQYLAQRRIPSSSLALLKKQLIESLPYVSSIASIIWFNSKDANIKNQIDTLYRAVSQNADQITLS